MGDDILKGSLDFDLALKFLDKMNKKMDEAIELVQDLAVNSSGDEAETKKKKLKKLLSELEDLKKKVLKALILKSLYDEMYKLDELIDEAVRHIHDNYNNGDSPENQKKARGKLVVLLKKVKAKKESIEKKLPKVPDNKMDWLYIMNRYLKSLIEGKITGGDQDRHELAMIVLNLHRYKRYALYWLPTKLCEENLDWWYDKFHTINKLLEGVKNGIKGKYAFFLEFDDEGFLIPWLKTMKSFKEDIEEKLKKYRKYY